MYKAGFFIPLARLALAILPAGPSNDTSRLNDTNSTVQLTWYPFGTYQDDQIALLNAASQRSGLDTGAFAHFSDAFASQEDDDYTTTPWIAFIPCDRDPAAPSNTTDDTFTLAKRRGATAVLLYSLEASTCLLHPEFETSLPNLNIDIYATASIGSASILESQFSNTDASFANYNTSLLNASAEAVTQSLTGHNARERSFIIATLESANASQIPGQPAAAGQPMPGTGSAITRRSISCWIGLAAFLYL